jgi:uncharacterized protein (TIGR04255 family)
MVANSYKRPPITEAVIQIAFAAKLDDKAINAAAKKVNRNYSGTPTQLQDVNYNINVDHDQLIKNTEHYYRLSSGDMTQICLIRKQSFSVSQLAPYTSWGEFISRFERDYRLFIEKVGYMEVSRIGVRYINRIDIPFSLENPIINENEYLNIFPTYPPMLGILSAYAIQQRSAIEELKSNLTINSAIVPSPLLNHMSIMFDQDIGREVELPNKIEEIVEFLDLVRIKKNEIFECCVTDKSRDLFQK